MVAPWIGFAGSGAGNRAYLGVWPWQGRLHPDLRQVRYSVLQTLGDLKSDLSNRELRKFIESNFSAVDGRGE